MKELIVIRHAKSDWGHEGLRDIDRCLSERGYSDAYAMSSWYSKKKKTAGHILSSTATRALSTALIFSRELNLPADRTRLEPRIYEASAEQILNLVRGQDEAVDSYMVFGHNPGFTNFLNLCAKNWSIDNLPTCGMVSLGFKTANWKTIQEHSAEVNFSAFPKDFRSNA